MGKIHQRARRTEKDLKRGGQAEPRRGAFKFRVNQIEDDWGRAIGCYCTNAEPVVREAEVGR